MDGPLPSETQLSLHDAELTPEPGGWSQAGITWRLARDAAGQRLRIATVEAGDEDGDRQLRQVYERFSSLAPGVLDMPVALHEATTGAVLVTTGPAWPTLEAWQAEHPTGTVAPVTACSLVRQLLRALARFHEAGFVHAALHPRNVLVNPDTLAVALVGVEHAFNRRDGEFAHAIDLDDALRLTYAAPELSGRINVVADARCDLYASGIILFELITGRVPFASPDPAELLHAHIARPAPRLAALHDNLPPMLSDIVARLLATHPVDRYRGARGAGRDLAASVEALDTGVQRFELGTADIGVEFEIPARLYGRDEQLEMLAQAYGEAQAGQSQVVTVSGYSGIGKSSLVHEGQRRMSSSAAWFGQGKFDQFRRDMPYLAWRQILTQLAGQLLAAPRDTLGAVRRAIGDEVGGNAALLIELAPELALVVGEQPPPPAVDPENAQRRFVHAVGGFFRALNAGERNLTVFLDDLQWADVASLVLLEGVVAPGGSTPRMLVLAAYRSNEVDEAHALTATLARLRTFGCSPGT